MTPMVLSAIENQFDAIASNALAAPYENVEGILLSTPDYELKHLSNFKSKCFTTRTYLCSHGCSTHKEWAFSVDLLNSLPQATRNALPIILSHRSACTKLQGILQPELNVIRRKFTVQ